MSPMVGTISMGIRLRSSEVETTLARSCHAFVLEAVTDRAVFPSATGT